MAVSNVEKEMDRTKINVADLPWATLPGIKPRPDAGLSAGMVDISPRPRDITIYLTNLMLDAETKISGLRLLSRAMAEGGLIGPDLAKRLIDENAVPQKWIEMALEPLVLGSYFPNFETGDMEAHKLDLGCINPELTKVCLNSTDFTRINPVLRIRDIGVQHATVVYPRTSRVPDPYKTLVL